MQHMHPDTLKAMLPGSRCSEHPKPLLLVCSISFRTGRACKGHK